MGARSGGGGSGGFARGVKALYNANSNLYDALVSKDKERIAQAKSSLKSAVSKLPTDSLKESYADADMNEYLSRKSITPKWDYSPVIHQHNKIAKDLYYKELNKRKAFD